MQRRDFLIAGAGLTAAGFAGAGQFRQASARDAFERSGDPRFNLGLAAYSLRPYFSYMKGKTRTPDADGEAIDMVGFLDYCKKLGCQSAELTSYFFKPDASKDYFRKLKHAAFVRGITISGTAIGNNFTVGKGPKLDAEIAAAESWIDKAAILGAPHIRFFAGTGRQLEGNPERMKEAVGAINHCAVRAAEKGIFLGVENHGNLTSDQMIQIMDLVESDWVGINLDTGNFISDDPYADIERCAPYAVNVQVKVAMRDANGNKRPADLPRIGRILKDSGYQGFVILEFEEKEAYQHIPKAMDELRSALA